MFDVKGGEGSSMLVLGGATYLGGVYILAYLLYLEFLCVIHYYAFIVCLPSCIELYIYVIVISM